jgi:chloramphenicol O-acetyltransferase type B
MLSLKYIFSRILKKSRLTAIHESEIDKTSKVESGSTVVRSQFGRHSYCGYDCLLVNCNVGSFCSIANRVFVGISGHPMDFVSTSPVFLSHKDSVKKKYAHHQYANEQTTHIGNDVWIGEGVYIKAGITIGHGSVVGMGSVVTKDVSPYSIVVGNPASPIRNRFEQDVIDKLLLLKWWEWPDDKLHEYGVYFNDPKKLLNTLKIL